jgi:hypothetical protein
MTATNISAESIQPKESIDDLLSRAKVSIEAGDNHMRQAAEDIAAAKEQGAKQRQIAEAVGKSVGWVNGLLKWREAGYPGTAFARDKRPHVQPAEQQVAGVSDATSALEPDEGFADQRDQRDAEVVEVIARLRETLADNQDVMALCDYVEWRHVEVPPYDLPSSSDVRAETKH